MSPTTSSTTEEPKESLPIGHPQAGYVSPDLSEAGTAQTLPAEEEEWAKARDEARQEEVDAVAEAEDKIVKDERKKAEDADKAAAKPSSTEATSTSKSS